MSPSLGRMRPLLHAGRGRLEYLHLAEGAWKQVGEPARGRLSPGLEGTETPREEALKSCQAPELLRCAPEGGLQTSSLQPPTRIYPKVDRELSPWTDSIDGVASAGLAWSQFRLSLLSLHRVCIPCRVLARLTWFALGLFFSRLCLHLWGLSGPKFCARGPGLR